MLDLFFRQGGVDMANFLTTNNQSTIFTLWLIYALRIVQFLLSIVLCVSIFFTYESQWRYQQITRHYFLGLNIWPKEMMTSFALECFVCMLHEFPFFDWVADISLPPNEQNDAAGGTVNNVPPHLGSVWLINPHGLLVFLRLYLVWRCLFLRYYPRGSKILAEWYQFNLSMPFAVRHIIKRTPVRLVLGLFAAFMVVLSYCQWVFEREQDTCGARGPTQVRAGEDRTLREGRF